MSDSGGDKVEALSRRDFQTALDFLAVLGEASTLDDFAARLGFGLRDVIPCDIGSYNEVNTHRQRVRWITDLDTRLEDVQAFERHIPGNPILTYFTGHPLGQAMKMSDLVSLNEWRSLGVYHDLYHPHRLEQLLAVEISKQPVSVAAAVFRSKGDFTERDRAMMTLLRPHLANLYRNAGALNDLGDRLALLQRGFDIGGIGAIMLRDNSAVGSMTATAQAWLVSYFGTAGTGDRLPAPVQEWLRRLESPASTAEAMPAINTTLVVDRSDTRLTLQFICQGARRLILMQEQRKVLRATEIASLGLAPREAEILAWLALGKTDAEIAKILEISRRTVNHTLERVYRKLGVETRVAAARRAFEVHLKGEAL